MSTEELWNEFRRPLWRYIRARVQSDADADDVLQDVFLKVHCRITQLRDDERVAGWLFRIASNAVVDHLRGRTTTPESWGVPGTSPPPTLEPDEAALLAQCVVPFIDTLPPHYREALTLTEIQGLTQADAAQAVGISVSGMKSRVQRGRTLLRESLDDCCNITLDARNRVVGVEARCNQQICALSEP